MARVLVVDDERAICDAFAHFLQRDGHEALIASNSSDALKLIDDSSPEAVFLDINMPGTDGLQTLVEIKKINNDIPVILMTAYGTMQTAITAMQEGAFDYLGKPVELQQLRKTLERALHVPVTSDEHASFNKITSRHNDATYKQLIGQSPAIQEVFKLMGLLTTNDLTVLLSGESGVGKELVAYGIHANSPKQDRPFIAVNCAAIPEQLIESELFGHEKGSFTGASDRRIGRFEAAQDSTLFLDEITELPLHLQSKLLRVLQERSIERVGSVTSIPINVRLIAATNTNLADEVAEGRFRQDLYHRLKLVTLDIPPLRDRKEDIKLLAYHFLSNTNIELGKHIEKIEDSVIEILNKYDWPGNVRELENTIKRAMLSCHGDTLTIHDLDPGLSLTDSDKYAKDSKQNGVEDRLRETLSLLINQKSAEGQEDIFNQLIKLTEETIIEEALRLTHGNQVAASKLLNLHRTTLRKKMGPKNSTS